MRKPWLLVLMILSATTVFAQSSDDELSPATRPDFSKPSLLRLLSEMPPSKPDPAVAFEFGAVDVRALGTRWKIGYLPFLMPLSGSVNYGRGIGNDFPDPFALTGTVIPWTARSWRDQRALSSELRRIERTERERTKVKAAVKVQPQ